MNLTSSASTTPGLWLGLWHGFILPVALIHSLLRDDVGIYAVHNDGAGYDIGFVIGVCVLLGSRPFVTVTRSRTSGHPRSPSYDPPPPPPWRGDS